jgi:hypothetical protein
LRRKQEQTYSPSEQLRTVFSLPIGEHGIRVDGTLAVFTWKIRAWLMAENHAAQKRLYAGILNPFAFDDESEVIAMGFVPGEYMGQSIDDGWRRQKFSRKHAGKDTGGLEAQLGNHIPVGNPRLLGL